MSAPTTNTTDLRLLETILGDTCDWMLAREIAAHPRWLAAYPALRREQSERKIRAIASSSGGSILSFPGSAGYKLRVIASESEVQTAVAKLRHQSGEMHARATAIENFGRQDKQLPLPQTSEVNPSFLI